MSIKLRFMLMHAALAILLLQTNLVLADPSAQVARLSYMQGDVSFAPAGETDWTSAAINRPLIPGDRLWTDRASRAELQIGTATARLDESSSFEFLNLNDNNTQIQLTQGTLNVRVRRIYDGQAYEIDTPTLVFAITRSGEYRFDVDSHSTTITVFSGAGEAYGEEGARFRLEEDESIRFRDRALHDYETFDLQKADDFDKFCFARDDREDHTRSRRYVSEEIVGYSDLDEYGSWSEAKEYGHIWYPSHVSISWAPYRDGHWAWIEPWGWTWVDHAPWGFAPFHYGRWAYVNSRWGWIPGPTNIRPVYAPALVAFISDQNTGVSVGIGIRNGGPRVGWFPLGPSEVYVPGYPVSRNYFNRINSSNTNINNTYITNVYNDYSNGTINASKMRYANRNVPNALTAVPMHVFVNARPVSTSMISMDRALASRAEVANVASIAPTRASLAPATPARATPPAPVLERGVIARTAPASALPPFTERQATLQRNVGRPLPPSSAPSSQPDNPNRNPHVRTIVPPNTATPSDDAFERAPANTRLHRQRTEAPSPSAEPIDRSRDTSMPINPRATTPREPNRIESSERARSRDANTHEREPDGTPSTNSTYRRHGTSEPQYNDREPSTSHPAQPQERLIPPPRNRDNEPPHEQRSYAPAPQRNEEPRLERQSPPARTPSENQPRNSVPAPNQEPRLPERQLDQPAPQPRAQPIERGAPPAERTNNSSPRETNKREERRQEN